VTRGAGTGVTITTAFASGLDVTAVTPASFVQVTRHEEENQDKQDDGNSDQQIFPPVSGCRRPL